MTQRCPTSFDEALVSGFLDGELTQAKEQKVGLHMEDCQHCRTLYDELRELREVAMTTRFAEPTDEQWDEKPRGAVSWTTRRLGWIIAIFWFAALGGYGLWQIWQAPQNLVQRMLTFGGLSAFVLLFISVLIDRIRSARTDRYQEVEK